MSPPLENFPTSFNVLPPRLSLFTAFHSLACFMVSALLPPLEGAFLRPLVLQGSPPRRTSGNAPVGDPLAPGPESCPAPAQPSAGVAITLGSGGWAHWGQSLSRTGWWVAWGQGSFCPAPATCWLPAHCAPGSACGCSPDCSPESPSHL